MILPGVVTNVTAFGAFVDIGVHQDGLVHISELADPFVRDPTDIVAVQSAGEGDCPRGRSGTTAISLSMKTSRARATAPEKKKTRRPGENQPTRNRKKTGPTISQSLCASPGAGSQIDAET